jgi:hypothetical protein
MRKALVGDALVLDVATHLQPIVDLYEHCGMGTRWGGLDLSSLMAPLSMSSCTLHPHLSDPRSPSTTLRASEITHALDPHPVVYEQSHGRRP